MLNVWRQIFNALSFRLEKEIYHKQNNCNPIKNQNSLEIDHGTISYVPAPTGPYLHDARLELSSGGCWRTEVG